MLIKIIDHRGKESWVNPAYIRGVAPRKDTKCIVMVSGGVNITVSQPADEVAGLINLALQEAASLGVPGSMSGAQISEMQAQAEAQQAAMIGAVVIGG
jgi:uncharacterized protein YlzI (FlbEa/FlbD family)